MSWPLLGDSLQFENHTRLKFMAYLQTAMGDTIEDPSFADIQKAIIDIQTADEEHAAFWYGTEDEEIVFEIHGDLEGFLVLDQDKQFKKQFKNWQVVSDIYFDLLNGNWESAKSKFDVSS